MDWELYKRELFDTGVLIFNLDHEVVKNINKFNINFQEKVNNNIIYLSAQLDNQVLQSNPQIIYEVRDKVVEMNKTSSSFIELPVPFPNKNGQIEFQGNYNQLRMVREFIIKKYNESLTQIWYYQTISDIDKDAFLWKKLKDTYLKLYDGKVTEKTVDKTYQQVTNKTNAQIQLYDEGCFIFKHSDGSPTDHYQCQMLLYIDEDWKPGMGGELFCINSKGKEIVVEPKIGTCVVLDFEKNPSHEVKVVTEKNYLRNVIRCDWIVDQTEKQPSKDGLEN